MRSTMRLSLLLFLAYTASWLVHDSYGAHIRHSHDENTLNEEEQLNPTSIHRQISDKALRTEQEWRGLYDLVVRPPSAGDLGFRFSKVAFADPTVDTSRLPLSRMDYPMTMETALWLSASQCPSVTIPEACNECAGIDFTQLVRDIGGPPSHAGSDDFWQELLEVAVVQEKRRNGTDVHSVLPLPVIWERQGFDLEGVSTAVHDEFPGIHHQSLIQYLYGEQGAKVDNSTVPQHCHIEFLRGIVMLSHINTWAIATVGPINFAVKYFEGRARPEEIAFKISTGEMDGTNGVPDNVLQAIPQGSLNRAVDFTAYPEGSPMHPSWPAMHSAASVGSTWLAVVLNLTEEQHCQAKLVDYGVAYARTVAGVHYASDNIAGLKLGQKIMKDKLPAYLHDKYGSDPALVRAKLDAVHVDWDTFLDSECYSGCMTRN